MPGQMPKIRGKAAGACVSAIPACAVLLGQKQALLRQEQEEIKTANNRWIFVFMSTLLDE